MRENQRFQNRPLLLLFGRRFSDYELREKHPRSNVGRKLKTSLNMTSRIFVTAINRDA